MVGFGDFATLSLKGEQLFRYSLILKLLPIESLNCSEALVHITPTHCKPILKIDIIHSTGFFQEWLGAVRHATRQSRSKLRYRAIEDNCTNIYVRR